MKTEACVEVRGLRHSYDRRRQVLRGVDLVVPQRGILALLGLNGSGKTTLLRAIMGLIRPQSGRIEVLGREIAAVPPPPELLARIGYVPERPFPAERMTARQLLHLVRSVHPRWDEETVRRHLRIFNIPLETRCKDLSAGTKAQLALTIAMAGRPELLILDEPTLGLDPLHRHQYLQLLLAEATGRDLAIVLTSHDLHQIERLADTIAILRDGVVAVREPLDELKERIKRVRVGADPDPSLAGRLASLPGVVEVGPDPGGYMVAVTRMTEDLAASIRALPGVKGIQVMDLSLEEIFLIYCGEPSGRLSID